MGIVVLLELVEPLDALILSISGDPVGALSVRRVHAAPSDPDTPGGPGRRPCAEWTPQAWWPTGGARSDRGRGGIRRAGPDTSA